MFRSHALFALGMLSCIATPAYADHPSLGFGSDKAGPIITMQAATLPQGKLAVGLTSEYIRSERFSDAALTDFAANHVHAHSVDWLLNTAIGVSYGLSDDVSLSVRIPQIHRENVRASSHVHGGGGPVNGVADRGDSSGIGDVSVLGKYRFWQSGAHQSALLFGVKAPTGRTNVEQGGERLDAEHQPGSGAWDGLFGFAVGSKAGPVSLDASALYSLVSEGTQDTDLGDRLAYNLAVSYRIGGAMHDHRTMMHQHQAWDLVLELNGEWMNQQEIAGETEENSGGNTIFLSPGLRYVPNENWSAQVSVGLPVVSNLGKGHTETDYKVTLGLSRAF